MSNCESRPLKTFSMPKSEPWFSRLLRAAVEWKQCVVLHYEPSKSRCQALTAAIRESYSQPYLLPLIASFFLVGGYLLAFLARHFWIKVTVQVLGWVGAEMIWLILSWGLVALLCYFALTHLGATDDSKTTQNGYSIHSGSNSSNSEWTNEVLTWMYNNFHKVPGPLDAWIKSLNDAAKKVTTPTKCEVLFEGFGDHSQVMQPPKLSDVRVEHGPRDHLTLRSHVHLPCVRLKLVSSQRTPERMVVSNFDANIVDLRGEIECRIACIANQLYLMGCFNGRPEMDIELQNTDANAQTQVSLGLVEESIRRCLLSAVTNINLSDALPAQEESANWRNSLPYLSDSFSKNSFQAQHSPNTSNYNYDTGLSHNTNFFADSNSRNTTADVPDMFKKLNESNLLSPALSVNSLPNKMRVKVIKANKLGKGKGSPDVQQPYVVIEMDEPAQRFTSTKGINASPYWEETFDFDITPASDEILFEIYEGKTNSAPAEDDKNFLGLSIVNFDEIRRSGQQIHTFKLQGRPYRKDEINGHLTCQFDFFFDPNTTAIGKQTDTVRIKNNNGSEFRETVTTERRRPVYDPHDNYDNTEITPTRTTTLVVKTVSQQLKDKPAIQSVHGSMENAVDPATQKIIDQQYRQFQDGKMNELEAKLQQAAGSKTYNSYLNGNEEQRHDRAKSVDNAPNKEERGRDRNKKEKPEGKRDRSFFGELRDRLSGRRRSQKRSKSVDINGAEVEEAVSLPPSRDQSRTRYAGDGTSRSFLETQSVGGKSGESSRSLYQHSTLVLELEQDKQQKYFLIPPSMLNEPAASKLMRRGKKLHIYNEHTFVAVKIRGGVNCNVCQQRIRSSFSKQAYQCRDCKLVCHKSCHYKTDAFCTQSTVSKLQIAKDVDWAHFLSHYQLEEFISFEGV